MRETQISKESTGRDNKRKPINVLPRWEPKVGGVLVGELSARGDDYWGGIDFGETIRIRTAPHTDTPFVVTGRELVHALRDIMPEIGDLLHFKRLPDSDAEHFRTRFSVKRLDGPEEGQGEAA